MPRRPDTLRVVPNPFAVLDHEGRPCARAAFDPDHHSPDFRHVGATVKAEVLESRSPVDLAAVTGDDRPSVHDRWWEFDPEPQTIPNTPYYRLQITDGTLLPADKATATKIGRQFRNPSDVIVETAKFKAEQFAREHGFLPDWAYASGLSLTLPESLESEAPKGDLHPSHATHVAFLAKHGAVAMPTELPPPPAMPRALTPKGDK